MGHKLRVIISPNPWRTAPLEKDRTKDFGKFPLAFIFASSQTLLKPARKGIWWRFKWWKIRKIGSSGGSCEIYYHLYLKVLFNLNFSLSWARVFATSIGFSTIPAIRPPMKPPKAFTTCLKRFLESEIMTRKLTGFRLISNFCKFSTDKLVSWE